MERNSAYGKWLEIKKRVEADIAHGKYKTFDTVVDKNGKLKNIPKTMPSISEMAKIYGCGKTTAQKIYEELCNEGVLMSKKGVGFFVKPLIRAKLKDKQLRELEISMNGVISTAQAIGLDKKECEEMFLNCISNLYS